MRVLAAALAACTVAAPASAAESTIYPGVGIGKVKLGMTKTQVVRALGKDSIVNERSSGYLELAWNYSSWRVGFARGRVVQVATSIRSQRTPKGVGVGASWRRVLRAYPGGACTLVPGSGAESAEYLVGHRGGTQTLYIFTLPRVVYAAPPAVIEVAVRSRFRPLPEFAVNWPYHCRKDWREDADPL
jgi:hypothetical protein